jgi:hypothetical protein
MALFYFAKKFPSVASGIPLIVRMKIGQILASQVARNIL